MSTGVDNKCSTKPGFIDPFLYTSSNFAVTSIGEEPNGSAILGSGCVFCMTGVLTTGASTFSTVAAIDLLYNSSALSIISCSEGYNLPGG